MNIDILKNVLKYSLIHGDEIEDAVSEFFRKAGLDAEDDSINIPGTVRDVFRRRGYIAFEIPMGDDGIKAALYTGAFCGFLLINSSLSEADRNFAICHEAYHMIRNMHISDTDVHFMSGYVHDDEEECAADLFAAMLLMPERSFRKMHDKYYSESEGRKVETVLRLMNYYRVPYMAVLIRGFQLGIIRSDEPEEYLMFEREKIREEFIRLWLDYSILESDGRDDFEYIDRMIMNEGKEYLKAGYISEHRLREIQVIMRSMYYKLKGKI